MSIKSNKMLGVAAVLALLAGPAMAQQSQFQGQNHGAPQQQHEQHAMAPPQHQDHASQPDNEGQRQANAPQHDSDRQQHNWHQGDRYNGNRVVVRDWGSHHLRQPPAGYEWVQNDNQYVLIAITSGIIASIIANSMAH
jgi:Ni/Co efflux regulator RcnB